MMNSLLQPGKIAAVSIPAFTALIFAALPSYSQDLGTFSSGPFRTDREFNREFDRSLQSLQGLGSDVVCGNDIDRSRRFSSRSSFRRRFSSSSTLTHNPFIPNRLDARQFSNVQVSRTLTNNPLVPNRLNTQQVDSIQIAQTLTNDPLVPNRLNAQPFNDGRLQTSSGIRQAVTCQTIRNSSITTINQPLSNHAVNITINNSGAQAAPNVATSRTSGRQSASDKLPFSAIASLPDGNYRLTSATNVPNDISNAELASSGGRLFTFKKSGNTIIGNLNDFDGGFNACVTGSVNGNLVTGQAFTNDLGTNVLGRNYLDPALTLELGEQATGDRYDNSVLNLSGFSRINAGTASPPTRC
ncbi:hypothetical protein [cf. Phormidesmis sp. LEGE 11477]|uniref:hypothetical protein n=1 Tax=cf. Phormidesmis sp. LEGE 11477 TaxID=1828680 RepID=UPI00187E1081|nr:hypothetical protein [cf. Phormidesmis sp. LEGE 11477]MBE9060244.1 hypothetical protein [cf. Phormidesmis sp. LEGE 11477]